MASREVVKMDKKDKICPLMSKTTNFNYDPVVLCCEEHCALWTSDKCAIVEIAERM